MSPARKTALAGLAFGALFGFALGWARLTDYDVIMAMLRLRELDVFLLMGSAIVTGAVGVRLLRALDVRSLAGGQPIAWNVAKPRREHVFGSVLFGLGWSIACTCPGPAAAQLGRGQLAALFTIGGLFGGIALRALQERRAAAAAAAAATPGAQGVPVAAHAETGPCQLDAPAGL